MYDLATIIAMNKETGKNAKKNRYVPLIAKCDKDVAIFHCPNLGNYEPNGWKKVNGWTVDNSRFGQDYEHALTARQFLDKVREGFGYAIVESGQFQVYIAEFEQV